MATEIALDFGNICGYTLGMAGRPPKSDDERRDNVLRIRLTADERAALDAEAQRTEADTSTWAREKLLKLAGGVRQGRRK